MEFIIENITVVLLITFVLLAVIGVLLFFRIKNKEKSKTEDFDDFRMMSAPPIQLGNNIEITEIARVENNKYSLEFINQGESQTIEANLNVDDDRNKFDQLFAADQNFKKFQDRKEVHFSNQDIMNDVRRYLQVNLKNINDSIPYSSLLKELDRYFDRQGVLLKNLHSLGQGGYK